jgi:hypothetical protein
MGMTVAMKSYVGRDWEHDGEEGVTAGINKCAECDSDNKTKLNRWWWSLIPPSVDGTFNHTAPEHKQP